MTSSPENPGIVISSASQYEPGNVTSDREYADEREEVSTDMHHRLREFAKRTHLGSIAIDLEKPRRRTQRNAYLG